MYESEFPRVPPKAIAPETLALARTLNCNLLSAPVFLPTPPLHFAFVSRAVFKQTAQVAPAAAFESPEDA